MALQDTQRFRLSSEVLSKVLDGEAVLLDLKSGTYFGLNPVGTRVWELLQSGSAMGDVRAKLLDEFEVTAETLEADLVELLEQLKARGLITPEL